MRYTKAIVLMALVCAFAFLFVNDSPAAYCDLPPNYGMCYVDLPFYQQQKDLWCWNASLKMILHHHHPEETFSQQDIANAGFYSVTSYQKQIENTYTDPDVWPNFPNDYNNSWNYTCDNTQWYKSEGIITDPNYNDWRQGTKELLDSTGLFNTTCYGINNLPNMYAAYNKIAAGQPFTIRWGGSLGHIVALKGVWFNLYDYLMINDPATGLVYWGYNYVVQTLGWSRGLYVAPVE